MPPPATTDFTLFLWTGLGVGWQREGRRWKHGLQFTHRQLVVAAHEQVTETPWMRPANACDNGGAPAPSPLSISIAAWAPLFVYPDALFAGSRRRWASRAVREVPRQRCGQIRGATRVCGAGQSSTQRICGGARPACIPMAIAAKVATDTTGELYISTAL